MPLPTGCLPPDPHPDSDPHPFALRHRPSRDLLALLLAGDAAYRCGNRPLTELFHLAPQPLACREEATPAPLPLLAAKELLARALAETLSARDALDSPQVVRDLLRLRLAHLPHEVFAVLLLDAQHRLIDLVELFRGTLTQTSVYPREVVCLALERRAAAVILAHNHPSGATDPSQADIALTRILKEALALVDVRVLDHFVVAAGSTASFAERGLI